MLIPRVKLSRTFGGMFVFCMLVILKGRIRTLGRELSLHKQITVAP